MTGTRQTTTRVPAANGTPPPLRRLLAAALLAAPLLTAAEPPAGPPPAPRDAPSGFAIGADLSFLAHAEQAGTVFKDHGRPAPGLRLLRDRGYNWIRLRLFHSPTTLPNDLRSTISTAAAARSMGYRFLLNLHYSDTWADPAHQEMPRAWRGMSHEQLTAAVLDYTRATIAAFRDAGAMPDMVQVGNEVCSGMLWPDGRLPANWPRFADLLKAGIRGVEAGRAGAARPRIMIHIAQGGNRAATRHFLDQLASHHVPFDVIGQSYYPWWHGTPDDLRANLKFMAGTYQKDIILVETAYCWRPTEYRSRPGPFPETPAGQRDFLDAVHQIVRGTPGGRGAGVFWWEPAVTGHLRSRGFFDDAGNALPVIGVFDRRGG